MAKHYSDKKSDSMAMPRDATDRMGEETQMYHMGKAYYGKGYGEPSNMPKEVDMAQYPKGRKYLDTDEYPDTLREIDKDNDFNYGQVSRHLSDSMY